MDPLSPAALIEAHLHLVEQVAHAVATRLTYQVEYDVLRAAARAGLADAAEAYRAEYGVSFAWWAQSLMRGAVLNQLRSGTPPKQSR